MTRATRNDPRRYLWLHSATVAILPFAGIGLARHTGLHVFWWATPIFVFIWFPLVDLRSGTDRGNPPERLVPELERDPYYRYCTYLYIPLQYAGLLTACAEWTSGRLTAADRLGLILTAGSIGGIGINTAHELGHKRGKVERFLAQIGLAQTFYGHFLVEHNRGHHVRVATLEDPASARLGESFWRFWPRSVLGGARSAWRLEVNRLHLKKKAAVGIENEVLRAWCFSLALAAALVTASGPTILIFLVAQAVVGFTLLESVNYLEHYGLARQRLDSGRYESVTPRHSWNSDQLLSNVGLFQLQRHSDHHANPRRPYQTLRTYRSSPQLPFGYATMIPLALVPAVWSRIMDPLVLMHYKGDVTLANIHPPAKQRILARYGYTRLD